MKSLKKFTAIILGIIMIFSTVVPSFALEEESNDYDFLLEQGYPTEHIDKLTDTMLQKMTNMIGDNYIADVNVEKFVFNENSEMTRGTIKEDNLTLEIASGTLCQNGTDDIINILVTVNWEWAKGAPLYRGKDAISVNWDDDIFSYADEFYANDVYKSNENDDWSVFKEYSTLAASSQGGLGHWSDLKAFKSYVGGGMIFLLNPTSPMVTGKTYSTTLNVEYVHSKAPITGLEFSIMDVGVGISWNLSCDSMADSSVIKFSR